MAAANKEVEAAGNSSHTQMRRRGRRSTLSQYAMYSVQYAMAEHGEDGHKDEAELDPMAEADEEVEAAWITGSLDDLSRHAGAVVLYVCMYVFITI